MGYSGNSNFVVARCRDDSSDVGSMPGLIHRIAIAIQIIPMCCESRGMGKVPADEIIDISVVVVVDALRARDFSFIGPDLVNDVGVKVVQTGIYYRNDEVAGVDRCRPLSSRYWRDSTAAERVNRWA